MSEEEQNTGVEMGGEVPAEVTEKVVPEGAEGEASQDGQDTQ